MGLRATPATFLLLASNVFVWLALETAGGSEDPTVLFRFGAKLGPAIADGQYWRLFVPIFLHIGFLHLLTNSVGLLIFGRIVENLFGSFNFIAIYLFSGTVGNVASYAAGPTLGAGASGAIFGIVGAYSAYMLLNHRVLTKMGGNSLGGLGLLILVNLAFGFSMPGIDNWAHLGGLAGGFAISIAVVPRPVVGYGNSVLVRVTAGRSVLVLAVAALAISLVTWVVSHQYPYSLGNIAETHLRDASRSISEGEYHKATQKVSQAVQIDHDLVGIGTAMLYLVSGLNAVDLGKETQAVQDLETAIRWGLYPNDEELALKTLQQIRSHK